MRNVSFLLFVLLFSCSENITSVESVPELEKEFEISYGERLFFKGTEISVKLVDVVDYRCNVKDITCVWSGDATVLLDIDGQQEEINLYYPNQDHPWQNMPASVINGYEIKLIILSPEHRETGNEPKSDYTAKLIVTPK